VGVSVRKVDLWESQKKFIAAGPQPTLFLGGVGCGKSVALILKTLYIADQWPGSRIALVRQRFSQLKRTVAATLFQWLPANQIAKQNANEGRLMLKNGSEIILLHLDKAESLNNLKSLELTAAGADQIEDINAEAWDTLYERVGRWSGATMRGGWPRDWPYKNRLGQNIPPRFLYATAYSPGYGHFVTERFWEFGGERARYRDQGYIVVVGSTRDNLALSDEYIKDRLAMGDEYVRRYVDAVDWGASEGAIFDLTPRSILEPTAGLLFKIKNTMRLHRVYDHGEAVPSAYLWYATDSEGNVFFHREGGGANMLVSEHRSAIYELSKEDGINGEPTKYYSNLADPAIFAKTRGRSINSAPTWSVADEWRDQKIMDPKTAIYFRPANNDEAMTINRVREYLKPDPTHRHPLTGKLGSPRLFFIKKTDDYPHGCHEVIVDIRAARRREVGVMPNGTKLYSDERDDQVRDHWLDCVRYAIGMRPALARQIHVEEDEPNAIKIHDYF